MTRCQSPFISPFDEWLVGRKCPRASSDRGDARGVENMRGIRRRQRARRNAIGEAPPAPAPAEHPRGRRTPEEARQEIIDVARAYISKHGFKGLTVEKLMRGTEIGRSAFYVYFGSINELAAVFVHELSAKIEAAIVGWRNAQDDPLLRVRETLRGGVEFWVA